MWFLHHPGLHINPHLDTAVIVASVALLVLLAVGIGLVHVYLMLRRDRRDRFIRRRLENR